VARSEVATVGYCIVGPADVTVATRGSWDNESEFELTVWVLMVIRSRIELGSAWGVREDR
jgi:hypothetical protein